MRQVRVTAGALLPAWCLFLSHPSPKLLLVLTRLSFRSLTFYNFVSYCTLRPMTELKIWKPFMGWSAMCQEPLDVYLTHTTMCVLSVSDSSLPSRRPCSLTFGTPYRARTLIALPAGNLVGVPSSSERTGRDPGGEAWWFWLTGNCSSGPCICLTPNLVTVLSNPKVNPSWDIRFEEWGCPSTHAASDAQTMAAACRFTKVHQTDGQHHSQTTMDRTRSGGRRLLNERGNSFLPWVTWTHFAIAA